MNSATIKDFNLDLPTRSNFQRMNLGLLKTIIEEIGCSAQAAHAPTCEGFPVTVRAIKKTCKAMGIEVQGVRGINRPTPYKNEQGVTVIEYCNRSAQVCIYHQILLNLARHLFHNHPAIYCPLQRSKNPNCHWESISDSISFIGFCIARA